MVAIIFRTGTKYACNERNDWDQMCLKSRLERGLNMLAISNLNFTIYDCNVSQKGPNMLAMSEIVPESRNYDFWTNVGKTKF